MRTDPPPPLEFKAAAAMLAPPGPAAPPDRLGPAASGVDDHGEITALVAVTGVVDDVGDEIVPGAFRRSLRTRTPRMCVAHDWGRVAGRAVEVTELMPGDPRLPRTTPCGEPWPPAAGALWVKATFLPTREGQDARAVAHAFGADHAFSIGFKAVRTRKVGGVRYLDDVDLYEFSPVLHGANALATVLSVKARRPARLETKATSAVTVTGRRGGSPAVVACGVCGRPAGAVMPGGLADGDMIVCPSCVAEVGDVTRVDGGTIPAADLVAADLLLEPDLTVEQEFERALADEQGYELETDGTVVPAGQHSPARTGRAWTRSGPTAGWGRP